MEGKLTVLVVDDMEGCRELYREWLTDSCTVLTATSGEDGTREMDHDVDLVILDRDLDGEDGRTVACKLAETEYDTHIVMISWMEPDFDIVEYPIESYVEKPVTEDDLLAIVDQYQTQQSYISALEEYFALSSKLAAIEASQPGDELETNDEYNRLKQRVAKKQAEVDEAITENTTDWNFTFKTCAKKIETAESHQD